MPDYVLLRTTVPTRELGQTLAERLVARRLAASVHVKGPTESTYWWREQVRHVEEWDCEIRTLAKARPRVEELIRELHPYEVAEVFALEIDVADPELRAWLEDNVRVGGAADGT
jgi:periplasmic divalent cation tolerance protein